MYILWGSPLLTTDINVTCSAPIAVIVRHGAPRRNHDRGTHIRFTGDRVFHICQKESLISLEMPFYKTAELDNRHSIATHLKEVNNKPNAISLHAYSSKKIYRKKGVLNFQTYYLPYNSLQKITSLVGPLIFYEILLKMELFTFLHIHYLICCA